MPNIFVNTDTSNLTSKIYKAGKVGKSAAAAEKKMQDVVRAIVGKAPGFVTDKSAAGKGTQSGSRLQKSRRPEVRRHTPCTPRS